MLIAAFTDEAAAIEVGAEFLRIISVNFIAQGIVFTCSGMFQGLGNTRPALLSSAARIAVFVPLALYIAAHERFEIADLWYLSVATVFAQAGFSYYLLQRQFRSKLTHRAADASAPA